MRRQAAAYRKKKVNNRFSMILVSVVVVTIVIVVAYRGMELNNKLNSYDERKQSLQTQIDAEKERTEELAEFEKYTQTKQYKEEVAKEKLGLVYEGEILFKQED